MNNLTAESIISTLADAGQAMPSRAIANALGVEHIGKVRALLTELVHDETVERAKGGKYQLKDAGSYEVPTRSANVMREILPTNTAAIKARERRKEKTKVVEVEPYRETNVEGAIVDGVAGDTVLFTPPKINSLEDAEQAADEEKARDQRIRDAVERLKLKSNFRVEPVDNLEFKIEILDGIGSADADLWEVLRDVIADLRRLDELSVGPF